MDPSEQAADAETTDFVYPLSKALYVFAALLVWGLSTHHFGLRGGTIGFTLALTVSGFILGSKVDDAQASHSGLVPKSFLKIWASVLMVVLLTAITFAFSFSFIDPLGLRRLGLSGLLGVSNWFQMEPNLRTQLHFPLPLFALFAISVAAQLIAICYATMRLSRRFAPRATWLLPTLAALAAITGFLLGAANLLSPTVSFFATPSAGFGFFVGALAAMKKDKLPAVKRSFLHAGVAQTIVLSLMVALTLSPNAFLYRSIGLPAVALSTALLLAFSAQSDERLSLRTHHRLDKLANFMLWPALLGFWVFAGLSYQQHHNHFLALTATQIVITFAISALGYFCIEQLFRMPRTSWSIVGLVLVPGLVLLISLPLIKSVITAFPSGPTLAGTSPIVRKAPPNPHHDVRSLLVGGSDAFGLSLGAAPIGIHRGVLVHVDSTTDCGLINFANPTQPHQKPIRGWRNPAGWARCSSQALRWKADLKVLHPSVVILAEGEAEVHARTFQGQRISILQSEYATEERRSLLAAVKLLSSRGASVILTTAPYYGIGVPLLHFGNPANDRARADAYNAILRSVAAETGATVFDLNRLVCPKGRFQMIVHGLKVRGLDGTIVSPRGGQWIQPKLLAMVRAVAASAQ